MRYRFMVCCLALGLALGLALPIDAAERVPADDWQQFVDPADAGFDPVKLEAARKRWEELPSSAFMVVVDGAVVAAWGDVDRRFMCHSVRKSLLSGLYGIYWDRGEIELNKTLADLGIDDEPDPLLPTEQRARILDLLKARSGVFHPAAYAGRTDSRPRGSEGPGRFFAYNNWDFNTLATILEQETGAKTFDAFDEHFGRPLQMDDWRVSDGYYHYERDKSKYPAYPFRLSARDAARFGLLFARNGLWGDRRILSEHWVRRSSALYSIDSDAMGYGFMWWVMREPRFVKHGMYAALGVGNQMIAALPNSDIVIVNRANTYEGEGTPTGPLLDLVQQVLEARTGDSTPGPRLVALDPGAPDPRITHVASDRLSEFAGEWAYPPPSLGLARQSSVVVKPQDGHVTAFSEVSGTFRLFLQPDGTFHSEDNLRRYVPIRLADGSFDGIADEASVVTAALNAAAGKDRKRADALLRHVESSQNLRVRVGSALVGLIGGKGKQTEKTLRELVGTAGAQPVERAVNAHGYGLLQAGTAAVARDIFALNTRLFPDAFNAWDSLGEAQMTLGANEEAIASYQRSLELNSRNRNAETMIQQLRERVTAGR